MLFNRIFVASIVSHTVSLRTVLYYIVCHVSVVLNIPIVSPSLYSIIAWFGDTSCPMSVISFVIQKKYALVSGTNWANWWKCERNCTERNCKERKSNAKKNSQNQTNPNESQSFVGQKDEQIQGKVKTTSYPSSLSGESEFIITTTRHRKTTRSFPADVPYMTATSREILYINQAQRSGKLIIFSMLVSCHSSVNMSH